MKKYLKAASVAAITVLLISVIAFTACTRKTTADSYEDTDISSGTEEHAGEFNIYGEWRYVITKGEFGDTYVEERLSTSLCVLRVFNVPDNGNHMIVEFIMGPYTYYGNLKMIEDHVYSFVYMSVSEYGNYEMNDTIRYDPATRRLGQEDGESGMSVKYYEWVGPTSTPFQFSPSLMHTQNRWLYGTWGSENKMNTLTFLEPNIFYEEGGTTVVGGRNTFNFSFDGRTLTIAEGDNESSSAPVTISGDTLTIGPFEGGHDWHYNLFLWGTFIKIR